MEPGRYSAKYLYRSRPVVSNGRETLTILSRDIPAGLLSDMEPDMWMVCLHPGVTWEGIGWGAGSGDTFNREGSQRIQGRNARTHSLKFKWVRGKGSLVVNSQPMCSEFKTPETPTDLTTYSFRTCIYKLYTLCASLWMEASAQVYTQRIR